MGASNKVAADDPVGQLVSREAAAQGKSLSYLSGRLKRNAAYVQQFVARQRPVNLPEDDRKALAAELNVNDELLKRPRQGRGLISVTDKLQAAPKGYIRLAASNSVEGGVSMPRKRLINLCMDFPESFVQTALAQIEALSRQANRQAPPRDDQPSPHTRRGETS